MLDVEPDKAGLPVFLFMTSSEKIEPHITVASLAP